MKKVITILAILSLVTLNLNSQVQNIIVSPTNVCIPSTGNASVVVQFTVNGLGTVAGCYSLVLMPTSTVVGGASFTIAPGISTGSLVALLNATNSVGAANIKLNFYTSCSTFNSTYSSSNQTINIVSPPSTTITSTPANTLCVGNTVTLSASGANNYTWMPSTVSSSTSISPSSNTIYTVSASSSICPAVVVTSTVAINAYSVPVVSASGGSICLGQTYTIPMFGATSYSINNTSVSSPTVSPTSNTTYTIKGISSQGCVSSNTNISVVVNINPIVSVNSGSICLGQQFVIVPTATSATSYSYSGGTASVSPTSNSNYIVTAYSSFGCTATATASVVVNSLPIVSVNSGTVCAGKTFTIIPTGAVSYTIFGGNFTVSPSSLTSYSVAGTNSLGCVSNSVLSTVSVSALPTISVNSGSICSGQSFTINASGASSYAVSGGTMIVTPLSTSNYTVVGTSSVGCSSSNTVISTVTVYSLPVISVNNGTICSGKIFTITPTGASSYTISGGSLTVSPISNSTYTVIGSSSVGCVNSVAATSSVTVNSLPIISVSSTTNSLCQGDTTTISAVGASSFVWAGNGNGSQIVVSPNTTTIYTVTGTNINGCESTESFTQTVVVCNTNTTGIAENVLNVLSRIYPVPANSDITVELSGVNDNVLVNITIYSLEGRVIITNSHNLYNSTAKVDLSSVQNGVYMLEVKSDSFRLVKNIIVAK